MIVVAGVLIFGSGNNAQDISETSFSTVYIEGLAFNIPDDAVPDLENTESSYYSSINAYEWNGHWIMISVSSSNQYTEIPEGLYTKLSDEHSVNIKGHDGLIAEVQFSGYYRFAYVDGGHGADITVSDVDSEDEAIAIMSYILD